MELMYERSRLGAGAIALAIAGLGAGAVIAQANGKPVAPRATAAASGGVSLTPQTVQHTSRKGTLGSVTIKNTTSGTLKVTVAVRPWLQNRVTGQVNANFKTSMGHYVKANVSTFNLAPGSRTISIVQTRTPPGGSLYAAIDVFGKQVHAKAQNGIIPQYRVVGRLRADPAHKREALRAGSVGFQGSGANRVLVMPIRNTGNTLDPIGGSIQISGPTNKLNPLKAISVVPGQVVNLVGGHTAGFKHGKYTAVWSITQGGKHYTARRSFSL
jgi:hypothetical protein